MSNKRLLQNHDTLIMWIQRLANAVVIVVTLLCLAWWRDGQISTHYRYMAIISVFTMLIVYRSFGIHRRFESSLGGIQHLARAWGTVIIIVGWVGFVTKTSEAYSRQVIFIWVILAFLLQASVFPLFYWLFKRLQTKNGSKPIASIVIGTEDIARHLTNSINRNVWLPDQVVGVVAVSEQDKQSWPQDNPPVLGTITELTDLIIHHDIRRVYIALPLRLTLLIEEIQNLLFTKNIDIIWAPDIFSLHLLNPSVKELAGVPLVTLSETPLMAGGPAFIKTCMDKCLALIGLIILSPILLITALAIKLNSSGPVIFKQQRHGWDGRVIEVWKFRSMYIHQVESGHVEQATPDDPRITAVGRRIRQTSVDELPQLFNVLQGTMSLVGPRPHAVEHNNYYSDKVGAYLARHRIKPGITGLAQINGCRGETETLDKMEKRIQYDLEYINHWSPWLDFKILLQTPYALLTERAH
jgi:putative colanic acid biosynthesis UDP-glucose lipid carrier transferase